MPPNFEKKCLLIDVLQHMMPKIVIFYKVRVPSNLFKHSKRERVANKVSQRFFLTFLHALGAKSFFLDRKAVVL
jgi:hypothetical protein